ncbi:MAG: hypothetical protein H6660_17130 [Ardenticatenaceae bacterium]|nr:hypothetical protein [Ardenticatenaceae bacterium]
MKEDTIMNLTAENLQAGIAFVQANARDIDKAMFAYHWQDGPETAVLAALAPYQNDDGGFGHGLEPDFRLPASSPMATSVALQYCTAINAAATEPLVQKAIRYLCETYQEGDFWYATDQQVNDAPHAFWWHVNELTPPDETRWPNPSAELVGYLHRYAELVPPALLARATARAQANLESSTIISGDAVQKYNILCWKQAQPYLPTALATAVTAKIRATYDHWHPTSPETFGELSIMAFAATPQSIMAQQFPALVDQLLDQEIARQGDDGGWWPAWHWGQYEDTWPIAQREWAGKMTADTLSVLRNFGKIERH